MHFVYPAYLIDDDGDIILIGIFSSLKKAEEIVKGYEARWKWIHEREIDVEFYRQKKEENE